MFCLNSDAATAPIRPGDLKCNVNVMDSCISQFFDWLTEKIFFINHLILVLIKVELMKHFETQKIMF